MPPKTLKPFCILLIGGLAATAAAAAAAAEQLRFEAEDYTTPKDAWIENKDTPNKWNLWSTDRDAKKKWSEGIVLRSPTVKKERSTPEEGAPVLHTHLTGIPKGTYHVEIKRPGRTLAVSLDGKTWRPFRGGPVARNVEIEDGTFDLWVDDRYPGSDPKRLGPCYYDYIILHPVIPVAHDVSNPGFEFAADDRAGGWSWWSRDGSGSAVSVTDEKHGGERAVRIQHDGERDWAFSSAARLKVKPGQDFTIRAWVKGRAENKSVSLAVVGAYDGKWVTWNVGSARTSGVHDWKRIQGFATIPDDVNEVYVRFTGAGKTDLFVDDVSLDAGGAPDVRKPKVRGWAKKRVVERLDRGVVALPTDGGVYVAWRLLRDDPADVAFNVYRQVGSGRPVRVNRAPVTQTTDMLDGDAPIDDALTYSVRAVVSGRERSVSGSTHAAPRRGGSPYFGVKLAEGCRFQKIGIADLNGDGRYDYVIKHPSSNVDPWSKVWYRSPETFKIEAYLHDGTHLWTNDLGWAIERGIWYSPMIVHDLDGDGRAEVGVKIGEGDPRDEEGRVTRGPEWLTVWDGMTGKARARVAWPSREGFDRYSPMSRNQMAVAYLDGKTPCIIALRGTYTRMKADAYQLVGSRLEPLWQYDNIEYGGRYWGQGAHFTHAVDVDNDGRDEVVLGCAVIDDNGVPLWSIRKGHNDHGYVGDIDPNRPGLEAYYGIETRQPLRGGMCLADAATGKILWQWDKPTRHVHATGMCSDIDPIVPGMECYSADADGHKLTDDRWMWAANGEVLSRGLEFGFNIRTAYWDADLQREILRGSSITDYKGGRHAARIEGRLALVADVLGDWREEIVTTVPGELRIYSTTIPAMDRRVCLMQDPIYRSDVTMNAMAYSQMPMTSTCFAAMAPNLNLTAAQSEDGKTACRVVVSAPLTEPVKGTVTLSADGVALEPSRFAVNLAPGERLVRTASIAAAGINALNGIARAALKIGDRTLRGQVRVRVAGNVLKDAFFAQAESFAEQGGGEVRVRADKAGVMEKAFSHWDDKGHWLAWAIRVPAGRYRLVVRYSAAKNARRALTFDGRKLSAQSFPDTGGFGDTAGDWNHAVAADEKGKPITFDLEPAKHTIRMENVDGVGLNLDYLALVPVR